MNLSQQKTKKFTLAELTHGLDINIQGDPQCEIAGVCTIQNALPGHITFLMNPIYKKYLPTTEAAAVILSNEDSKECPSNVNAVVTKNPYFIYSQIAAAFDPRILGNPGIHATAVIGKNCQIHPTASIGPHCVIADNVTIEAHVVIAANCVIGRDSEIGENSKLDANVTVYHQVKIGKRAQIASGVVMGSDGFGIAKQKGAWHKVPQLGKVIIGDDVEIGANCTIDRGAINDTVIGNGVKLDNLIQVGHNVHIGDHTAIAACVAIAGSAVIGKNCMIGGGSAFAGHITVADNVVVTGMSAVTKSIRDPGVYSSGVGGLTTNLEWKKTSARVHRLDQLMQRVKELEQKVNGT